MNMFLSIFVVVSIYVVFPALLGVMSGQHSPRKLPSSSENKTAFSLAFIITALAAWYHGYPILEGLASAAFIGVVFATARYYTIKKMI